jgi:hypothetical protein
MCLAGTILTPRIQHSIPGRVRIHLPHWPGQGGDALEQRLRRCPGVRSARANPLTGTVLVHFDPRTTDQAAVLRGLSSAEAELTGAGGTTTGRRRYSRRRPAGTALRAAGAGLGLSLVGASRLGLLKGILPGAEVLAAAAKLFIFLYRLSPFRAGLESWLGPALTEWLAHLAHLVADMLGGNVLGLILCGLEALFGPTGAVLPVC